MKLRNLWGHIYTINEHKIRVMKNCFRVGLIKQGLLHDMSKYSPEEFFPGVFYYQGDRSPNAAEIEEKGYSKAWLHHKGRNKHHCEYWIDFSTNPEKGLIGHKMPLKYVIEMVMDRIAASKTYKGKDYTDSSPWDYYEQGKAFMVIAPETEALLEKLLLMLKNEGEVKTFQSIRRLLKKGDYC
ncbi:DUF5662 family protein [Clostridium sp. E02]|uniref:DUF5662 family protein n=1 Tax=Clostridium sp. E02 TaxID=2487134 RepID=UPI000F52F7D8|nr:DUF5662 family protein [Clostridium sp. E02]